MAIDKLVNGIKALSGAETWDKAKLEWELDRIYEEPGSTCLCGHNPITEVCILKNKINQAQTEVGNCCVQKFMGLSSNKLFKSLKRIRKDIEKSVNAEIVTMAYEKSCVNHKDYNFYMDTWRKRKVSEKQLRWRRSINQRILRCLT